MIYAFVPPTDARAFVRTIQLGPQYRVRFFGFGGDPGQSELAVRVLPRKGKPWQQMIFRAGFGYPDTVKCFRLRGTTNFCIVSTTASRINSFSNIWMFDPGKHRFVQAARSLLNLHLDQVSKGKLREEAGPQYVGGFPAGSRFMVRRDSWLDSKTLSVRYGKWIPYDRY